jgi:hypothetical protein
MQVRRRFLVGRNMLPLLFTTIAPVLIVLADHNISMSGWGSRALTAIGLRCRDRLSRPGDASSHRRALVLVAVAGVGVHVIGSGMSVGHVASAWALAPVTLLRTLVHGPLEWLGLSFPLAALLACSSTSSRRSHLARCLGGAFVAGVLLLVIAATVEANVSVALVTHLISPASRGA